MMLDSDAETIDKVSEPYERYNHENKSTQKRYKSVLHNRYRDSASIFGPWKDGVRLRSAVSCNNIDRVQELLEKGVNPNLADESGRTALHLACCRGFSGVVKMLLDFNADCNVVDKLGNTPLHLAVCTTSKATVDLLLKAGCSVSKRGNNGCTPLQLAQSKLWLMQSHKHPEYNSLKAELAEVIEMMKKLVPESSEEAQLVDAFSTQLSVSQSDEVVEEMKQLLGNINGLGVSKSFKISVRRRVPGCVRSSANTYSGGSKGLFEKTKRPNIITRPKIENPKYIDSILSAVEKTPLSIAVNEVIRAVRKTADETLYEPTTPLLTESE